VSISGSYTRSYALTESRQATTVASTCNVCGSRFERPIYQSKGSNSVTSLCHLYPGTGEVFFCAVCEHIQTTEINGIADYYDREYQILVDSEEEDQLYEVGEKGILFRSDHQVRTLLTKLNLPSGARILDYGCAKAATLRKLVTIRSDLVPHLFDVSRMYIPFWQKFVTKENWAVYDIPPRWDGYFDVVTTFFALEHVGDPAVSVRNMARLLKPGGILYGIVPNVFTNWADFVVVDHVNHFSITSLQTVLVNAGLETLEIDGHAHTGAFVFRARRPADSEAPGPSGGDVSKVAEEVLKIAEYWRGLGSRIQDYESALPEGSRVAIYGSGFYGTFIAASLKHFPRVECFLDRNPFRQGKKLLGKPILAPDAFPEDFDAIYVGINPANARKSIADLGWEARKYEYFFL
jgi:SAM-dependent methyltransferase